MVMMNPPGSRPGMRSFANAPAKKPMMIMMTHSMIRFSLLLSPPGRPHRQWPLTIVSVRPGRRSTLCRRDHHPGLFQPVDAEREDLGCDAPAKHIRHGIGEKLGLQALYLIKRNLGFGLVAHLAINHR